MQGYKFEIGIRWRRGGSHGPSREGRCAACGYLGVLAGLAGRPLQFASDDVALNLVVLGCVLLAVSVALKLVGTPQMAARPIDLPFRGRWRAFNSPADRVPSHIHGHGQTLAIDFVFEPEDRALERAANRPVAPPQDFPGYGQPILAPADGRVVSVRDRARDHRSRRTPNGRSLLRLEALVREATIGGGRLIAGNKIVLDLEGCLRLFSAPQAEIGDRQAGSTRAPRPDTGQVWQLRQRDGAAPALSTHGPPMHAGRSRLAVRVPRHR